MNAAPSGDVPLACATLCCATRVSLFENATQDEETGQWLARLLVVLEEHQVGMKGGVFARKADAFSMSKRSKRDFCFSIYLYYIALLIIYSSL